MSNGKVRQRQAYAMGSKPSVGTGGGNPFKTGNAGQSITGGSSKKPVSKGVAGNHTTHAKPKGAK